jgi:LysM repeat protein
VIPVGGDYTASTVHIVSAGETLSSIARRYNTTIWDIVVTNNLQDSNYIYVGQRLVIP